MPTPILIGPVAKDHAVRIAIRTGNSPLKITHLRAGETWGSTLATGDTLTASEIDITDVMIGRTHLSRLGAPVA